MFAQEVILQSKPSLFICECSSTEHQIVATPDEDLGVVYFQIHLTKHSFWRIVKAGLIPYFLFKNVIYIWLFGINYLSS